MLLHSNFTHEAITFSGKLNHLTCTVHDFNVAEGLYHATLALGFANISLLDQVINAAEITVEGGDFFGTGSKGCPTLCKTLTRATWKQS